MSSKDDVLNPTAWCLECKRLFEAFSEADLVYESLISEAASASVEGDLSELNKVWMRLGQALSDAQCARTTFMQHRATHRPPPHETVSDSEGVQQ
jgi:hypothetical protein